MLSLNVTQRALILGSLLGDGAMRCKVNALLEINHCAAQRSYVDWKYGLLADLVSTPPKLRNGNAGRRAYRFTTRSLPELTPFYKAFYRRGVKAVPPLWLSPLSLATWFMDDGSKSRNAVYLNTQQFDCESQALLVEMLRAQFGIAASLNRDKQYLRIRIAVGSMERFGALVGPHILPEMRYKLPNRR